jgi:hypothetical protein
MNEHFQNVPELKPPFPLEALFIGILRNGRDIGSDFISFRVKFPAVFCGE